MEGTQPPLLSPEQVVLCWVWGCARGEAVFPPHPGMRKPCGGLWSAGCASLPALVWGCGCARVLLGHVADAHECPHGGFTKPLIHVAIGCSDPRCGARSSTRVMAARARRQPEGPEWQNPEGRLTWVGGGEHLSPPGRAGCSADCRGLCQHRAAAGQHRGCTSTSGGQKCQCKPVSIHS